MKNLKKITTSAFIAFCLLLTPVLAAEPQKRDDPKRPPKEDAKIDAKDKKKEDQNREQGDKNKDQGKKKP